MDTIDLGRNPLIGTASATPSVAAGTRRWLWMAAAAAGAMIVTLTFFAYGQPGLLLEFMNLRFCG